MSPDTVAAATPFRPARLVAPRRADDERAGFAAGWAAGAAAAADAAAEAERRRAEAAAQAERRRDADVAAAVDLLAAAARELTTRAAADEERVRATLRDAALELAEAVLRRELVPGPGTAREVLERALALPAGPGAHTIAVSPADHAEVTALLAAGALALPDGVALVPAPALAPGDVVVEDATGATCGRIRAALDRARTALTEDAP